MQKGKYCSKLLLNYFSWKIIIYRNTYTKWIALPSSVLGLNHEFYDSASFMLKTPVLLARSTTTVRDTGVTTASMWSASMWCLHFCLQMLQNPRSDYQLQQHQNWNDKEVRVVEKNPQNVIKAAWKRVAMQLW